jgi:hypothetical protein
LDVPPSLLAMEGVSSEGPPRAADYVDWPALMNPRLGHSVEPAAVQWLAAGLASISPRSPMHD